MTDMKEKIARAIAGCDVSTNLSKEDQTRWVESTWEFHSDQAQAALQALMEPTDEMVEEMDRVLLGDKNVTAYKIWQASIKEAMGERK